MKRAQALRSESDSEESISWKSSAKRARRPSRTAVQSEGSSEENFAKKRSSVGSDEERSEGECLPVVVRRKVVKSSPTTPCSLETHRRRSLQSCTPRKLVNNFTKVYNSYNRERTLLCEDDDDSSVDEFIHDGTESSDSESASSASVVDTSEDEGGKIKNLNGGVNDDFDSSNCTPLSVSCGRRRSARLMRKAAEKTQQRQGFGRSKHGLLSNSTSPVFQCPEQPHGETALSNDDDGDDEGEGEEYISPVKSQRTASCRTALLTSSESESEIIRPNLHQKSPAASDSSAKEDAEEVASVRRPSARLHKMFQAKCQKRESLFSGYKASRRRSLTKPVTPPAVGSAASSWRPSESHKDEDEEDIESVTSEEEIQTLKTYTSGALSGSESDWITSDYSSVVSDEVSSFNVGVDNAFLASLAQHSRKKGKRCTPRPKRLATRRQQKRPNNAVEDSSEEDDKDEIVDDDDVTIGKLFEAVCSGQVVALQSLSEQIGLRRVMSVRSKGRSLLHLACEAGHVLVVKWLLDNGADPNIEDHNGQTALTLATMGGHHLCLRTLFQHTNHYKMKAAAADCHPLLLHQVISVSCVCSGEASTTPSYRGAAFAPSCATSAPSVDLSLTCGPSCLDVDLPEKAFDCLCEVDQFNRSLIDSQLEVTDWHGWTALALACDSANSKCVRFLLERGARPHFREPVDNSTLWHLVVTSNGSANTRLGKKKKGKENKKKRPMASAGRSADVPAGQVTLDGQESPPDPVAMVADIQAAKCVMVMRECQMTGINITDQEGFTPLMRAAAAGRWHCVQALLAAGASFASCLSHAPNRVSALHLAAAEGHTHCVEALLAAGHPVDCCDAEGWPPLLYANFLAHETCVLKLMMAKPDQLGLLGILLKRNFSNGEQRERTFRTISKLLTSLANHDSYYRLFNDFVRKHVELLDDERFSFAARSTGLLDFRNKCLWLRRRLKSLHASDDGVFFSYEDIVDLEIDRGFALSSIMRQSELLTARTLQKRFPSINFSNEHGMALGPQREFMTEFCRDIFKPDHKLFINCDNHQYMPSPVAILQTARHLTIEDEDDAMELAQSNFHDERLEQFTMIGQLLAAAVVHDIPVDIPLVKPFVKLVLSQPLKHPDDLKYIDHEFYKNAILWPLENDVEDLELSFTAEIPSLFGDNLVVFPLKRNGDQVEVTENCKEEYVHLLSKFKLEKSIEKEVRSFQDGLFAVLPQFLLTPFTSDEFSLLLSGVKEISVADWKANTTYLQWTEGCEEIVWFWRLVGSLTQDEKALLLKFATAQTTLPVGGFAELRGLTKSGFTISKMAGKDKIPHASTCFNLLSLPRYSSFYQLREKLLIAIRHGSEGFAFS